MIGALRPGVGDADVGVHPLDATVNVDRTRRVLKLVTVVICRKKKIEQARSKQIEAVGIFDQTPIFVLRFGNNYLLKF